MDKNLKEPLIPNNSSIDTEIEEIKKATYLDISFFTWLLFGWIPKYIKVGLAKPFQQNMHSQLRDSETAYGNFVRLHQSWEENNQKKYALIISVFQTVKKPLIVGFMFMVSSRLIALMGPYIMRELIKYIQSTEFEYQRGIVLVGLIGLTKVLVSLCSTQGAFSFRIAGSRAYNAVNVLVYHKSLKFSLIRSSDQSLGKMMNYMQVDSYKLLNVSEQLATSLTAPIQIIAGVIMMYNFIGIASISGMIVLICTSFLNYKLSKRMIGFQKQVMLRRDERMKLTNEIVNGIKFIKMSGWEEHFLKKGQDKRLEELSILKTQYTNQLMQIFSGWSVPMIITVSVFGTYMALGNTLTAEVAFPVVSVFFLLQMPLRMLPNQINQTIETFVALNRIQKFLLEEEISMKYIKRNDLWCQDAAIKIENGNFYWIEPEKLKALKKNKDKKKKLPANGNQGTFALEMGNMDGGNTQPQNQERVSIASSDKSSVIEEGKPLYVLKNINLEIKKGSFVAIIGDVGSGKSSLLCSLLGEMKFHDYNMPQVSINGETAYIPQKPWIINETLKANVLFEAPYDERRYRDALRYSCLESDIHILPNGDQTEIGEKGVNLSGGQKARVALAQAIYADKDIYLLDDPLSAVDVHVGTFIIQECLSSYLKDKTRVIITHNLDYLKYVDYVYIMRRGRIVGQGTYKEIKAHSYYKRLEQISHRTGSVHSNDEANKPTTNQRKESAKPQKETVKTAEIEKKKKSSQKKQELDDDPNLKKLILDEDRQTGKLQTDVYKAFYNFYGGLKFFLILFFSMVIWMTLAVGSNIYLSHWTAGAHTGNREEEWHSLTVYGVLALSCAFFNVARAATIFFKSIECSGNIHENMLRSVIRASINLFFDRVPLGRILNRFSKDLNIVDTMVAFSTMRFVTFLFMMTSDIIICVYGGTYFILPLVGVFFYFCFRAQQNYQTLSREVYRLESVSRSPILSHFSETINGLMVIRGYGVEERFFKDQTRQQDTNMKNHILLVGLANWFSLNTSLLSLVLIIPSIAVCVCMKDYLGTSGGIVGLLITYCLSCDEDIRQTLAAHVELQSHLISIERCLSFINIAPEASEKTLNPKAIANYSLKWPTDGGVELANYSVRYRPALPLVLTNISLSIQAHEKIGIVGRTGSGKSTLILSLLRILEPATGSILIDGVDISNIGLYELRSKVTVIPQDPMLFSGTLRQNIDIAKEFTNEQIWEVMASVSLHEKIESKEGGLDMIISEDGRNLSAGEKQLICIARAILKKNKVILIDEATSNIDIETESFIQSSIREKLKDSTVLTIAHRLKTIIESDKILVLGEGKVIEFDTPQNLLENQNSFFYGLWEKAKKENAIID